MRTYIQSVNANEQYKFTFASHLVVNFLCNMSKRSVIVFDKNSHIACHDLIFFRIRGLTVQANESVAKVKNKGKKEQPCLVPQQIADG